MRRYCIIYIFCVSLSIAHIQDPTFPIFIDAAYAEEAKSTNSAADSSPVEKEKMLFLDVIEPSVSALLKLFVIALLLESALLVLFNWRPYLSFINSRGANSLIAVGVAWVLVSKLDVNVVSSLVQSYIGKMPRDVDLAQFLTALIIAGGSGGIHRMLTALGYREAVSTVEDKEKPRSGAAWVSIHVERRSAVGPVFVAVVEAPQAQDGAHPAPCIRGLAGTVVGPKLRRRLWRHFFRDFDRFPQSGGYAVAPGREYVFEVIGFDAAGNKISNPITARYVFADRAVVDFEVTL